MSYISLFHPYKPLSFLQHFLQLCLAFPCSSIHPSQSHFCNRSMGLDSHKFVL
jgi:hypothetical protein